LTNNVSKAKLTTKAYAYQMCVTEIMKLKYGNV